MPELNKLCSLSEVNIVNLRSELVENYYLACSASLCERADLLEGHARDGVVVENKVYIKILVVLELVVYKSKVARQVVAAKRYKRDLFILNLVECFIKAEASFEYPSLDLPYREVGGGYS